MEKYPCFLFVGHLPHSNWFSLFEHYYYPGRISYVTHIESIIFNHRLHTFKIAHRKYASLQISYFCTVTNSCIIFFSQTNLNAVHLSDERLDRGQDLWSEPPLLCEEQRRSCLSTIRHGPQKRASHPWGILLGRVREKIDGDDDEHGNSHWILRMIWWYSVVIGRWRCTQHEGDDQSSDDDRGDGGSVGGSQQPPPLVPEPAKSSWRRTAVWPICLHLQAGSRRPEG